MAQSYRAGSGIERKETSPSKKEIIRKVTKAQQKRQEARMKKDQHNLEDQKEDEKVEEDSLSDEDESKPQNPKEMKN